MLYNNAQAKPRRHVSRTIVVRAQCTIIGLIVVLFTINIHLSSKYDTDTTNSIPRRRLEFFVTSRKGHPLKELVDEGEPQRPYEESTLFIIRGYSSYDKANQ